MRRLVFAGGAVALLGLGGCASCAGNNTVVAHAPGAPDPEALARTIVDALQTGDEAAYAETRDGPLSDETRGEFVAIRKRGLDLGVKWPQVRLDRTAFQIREDDGVQSTSLSLVLREGPHLYRLWVDGARKTEAGWLATGRLRWSFGPLDSLLGHWTVDLARLPPEQQAHARTLQGGMDVHIRVDGIRVQAAGREEESTYRVKETTASGGTVLEVKSKGQTADVVLTREGEGLRMLADGRPIPLRRK